MAVRKCSNCKHYEPAPIWRKGWCRNPLLYSPQQSHLVGEDDLDCDRGMGNYWEAIEGPETYSAPVAQTPPSASNESFEADTWHGGQKPSLAGAGTGAGAPIQFMGRRQSDSGSGGEGGDMSQYQGPGGGRGVDDDDDIDGNAGYGGREGGGPPGGERGFTYSPEERYWTDYLRIAAPVLGVILMLGLVWFWINTLIGDDEENATPPGDDNGISVITGGSPTAENDEDAPMIVATPENDATPEAPGEIGPGATVVVANTGGTGVNLRSTPSTEGEIVATLDEGTSLTITGEATEADGYTWWPVESAEAEGYVVEDFLELEE